MEWVKAFISLIGRVLLVLIFLNSGIGKIGNFEGTAQYMAKFGMPFTNYFLMGAIFLELVGSITMILGYYTRFGAFLLLIFLIPTTLIYHTHFADPMQKIHFMKNISMLGGCLLLFSQGPGRLSLDGVEFSPVINTYRHDLYFADEDFNQPTKIPPFIAINHSPAFPGTNETAVITIRATQGAARPTIDKPLVVAVTPLNPEGSAQLSDLTVNGPTETQDVGDRTRVEKFEITTTNAVSVILAVQAYTGAAGIRQVGYELTFGAAAPPPTGTLTNPDPEDDQPPVVARTVPPEDGFIGPTDPILIEFNEPIRAGGVRVGRRPCERTRSSSLAAAPIAWASRDGPPEQVTCASKPKSSWTSRTC